MALKAGKLDGKGYSAYTFRHSFATHMLDAGVDLHTIKELLGRDEKYMGAAPGIISVLHTWGQNPSFHPHVHCIVSGGGLDHPTGRWKVAKKAKYNALFPIQIIDQIYKGRVLHLLTRAVNQGTVCLPAGCDLQPLLDELYAKRWVVYAKQPFGGPQQVVKHLVTPT